MNLLSCTRQVTFNIGTETLRFTKADMSFGLEAGGYTVQ